MGGPNNAVSSISAYFAQGTASSTVSNVASQKTSQTKSGSFDDIFNKVSGTMTQTQTTDASKNANGSIDESKSLATAVESTNAKTANAETTNAETTNAETAKDVTTEDTSTAEDATVNTVEDEQVQAADQVTEEPIVAQEIPVNDELTEAINEIGEELISQISETFDVSEEDIVNAMQVLGLMAADLLNPANLTQLITQVTGQEGAIDLITDSDIYTSLQDLMEGAESMKSGLMNEFNLSEEDLQAAIDNIPKGFKEQLEGMENMALEEPEITTLNEQQNIPDATKKAPESEVISESAQTTEEPIVEVATQKSNTGGDNNENLQSGAESSNLFNQVMDNITEAAANVEDTSAVSYTDRAQMENIIRQITDRITISAGTDETSMELQLHPASLGNVNILLTSSKDGIVAKFTAQNEIVREAVESQMVQLQQKFDEQGIKVTSIEVTLASHGFEQNLEQGNDGQSGEANEGKKTKPLRRINLSDLTDEDLSEPENEAEKIAVQMMEANGNSVDFSA